jgi:hypothetical protein
MRNAAGRAADMPLSTVTTSGSQQRLVQTMLVERDALPPELLDRAVMTAAFLVKYYGTDGDNEAAQSQPVNRPMDTVTTKARFAVVTVTIDATTYIIVDIGLRMLTPRELARAQGFPRTMCSIPWSASSCAASGSSVRSPSRNRSARSATACARPWPGPSLRRIKPILSSGGGAGGMTILTFLSSKSPIGQLGAGSAACGLGSSGGAMGI